MSEKNPFGGGNPNSLYTPMSEDEQEAISRLVAARDLHIHVYDYDQVDSDGKVWKWGVIHSPVCTFGDLRLDIPLCFTFDRPEDRIIPTKHLDLELRTGQGILLFKERVSTLTGLSPIPITKGFCLQSVWTIGIRRIDPRLVKMIKPGAIGLTSRWTDKDTGDLTFLGNTKMSDTEKKLLRILRQGEALARADTRNRVKKRTGEG